MNKRTVFEVSVINDKELGILVDSDYAHSLFKHLKSKGANCTPPKEAAFQNVKFSISKEGRILREDPAFVHDIEFTGTLEEFDKCLDGWDPNIS